MSMIVQSSSSQSSRGYWPGQIVKFQETFYIITKVSIEKRLNGTLALTMFNLIDCVLVTANGTLDVLSSRYTPFTSTLEIQSSAPPPATATTAQIE
jgi:hypothetical protein